MTSGPGRQPVDPAHVNHTMSDDHADPEQWERDDMRAEANALRDASPDQFYGAGCRPFCGQCSTLLPIHHYLHEGGWHPYLETQLGGGMHAIHVTLDDDHYALVNDESFTIYDSDDHDVSSMTWSTDDPPRPAQMVTLFRLTVEQWRLGRKVGALVDQTWRKPDD